MTVFLIILAVLVIILLIPIRMELDCNKDELKNETSILVKYAFIKFRIYPKKKKSKENKNEEQSENVEKLNEKEPFSFENKKKEIENYLKLFNSVKKDVVRILSYTSKHAVIFDKIGLSSEFGFEDAM